MNTTTTTFAPFSQWQRLDRRYRLLIIATLIIAAGLWLGWEWLAAIGALPLLLSLLPCVAMCALGLCMRGGSSSCENQAGKPPGNGKEPT